MRPHTNPHEGAFRAGAGRVDITPQQPVPLAGYFTVFGRKSEKILDPLFVRAIAFEQDSTLIVLLIFDLLLITNELTTRMNHALSTLSGLEHARAMCIATHTHSGQGGYWKPLAARMALGPFIEGTLEALVKAGTEAAHAALLDLDTARYSAYTTTLRDICVNRRDAAEKPDAHLWALRLARNSSDILLCGFPAHPIIAAERDSKALSADFPGRVVAQLEKEVHFAAFVNGPLGGTGTLLLESEPSAAKSIALQADPIARAVLNIMSIELKNSPSLRFSSRCVPLPGDVQPRSAFNNQGLGRYITWPLDKLAHVLFRKAALDSCLLQAIAVGEAVLMGTPADLGISVAQAMRNLAETHGIPYAFAASQSDGYIGYVFRSTDYSMRPRASDTLMMALYENLMGMYGHDMGERLIEEMASLLETLMPEPTGIG